MISGLRQKFEQGRETRVEEIPRRCGGESRGRCGDRDGSKILSPDQLLDAGRILELIERWSNGTAASSEKLEIMLLDAGADVNGAVIPVYGKDA